MAVIMKNRLTALVTGGGGGIGREICLELHRMGCDLVVVSLLPKELDNLKTELDSKGNGQSVFILQKDLSVPGAAAEVYSFCRENGLSIDVLVNNVGFGLEGMHLDLPLERVRQMLVLNMIAMTEFCNCFCNDMKERRSGFVLNVSSTISLQPLPFWAAYAGTKAYVSNFSQALAAELGGFGITVSCLYPGITATNFLSTAGLEKSGGSWSVGSLIHRAAMDPRKVARAGVKGLFRKKRRIFPGLINLFHFIFVHFIPNRIILKTVSFVMARYRKP
jgi:short-subunit dehydrogenase